MITSQTSTVSYVPNGATTVFSIPFPFLTNSEVDIFLTVDGVRSEVTTGITVSGAGNPVGGSVTFSSAPTGSSLIIERNTTAKQEVDYVNNDAFEASSHESQMDRLAMATIDTKRVMGENLSRSIRVPVGESLAELAAAASRLGRIIYFNDSTGAIELKTPDEILLLSSGVPDGIGIPSGGVAGQYLKSLGGGLAEWADITGVTPEALVTAAGQMTPAQEDDFRVAVGAEPDVINSQPWAAAKIAGWTLGSGGSAPPLRVLFFSDSLGAVGGGLRLGPLMGNAGIIGLQTYNATGTVTNHAPPGDGRFDYWINGSATTFAIGAQAELTAGGAATGNVRGDKACIGIIKGAGRGSFDLQYQTNGTGSWTTLANINTSNATTVSEFLEYNLPTSNTPFYRLRITNVTTGSVTVLLPGIYNSDGGGVIAMPVAQMSGLDLTQAITTPAAVFNPLWTGLAPDVVVSIFADDATNWDSGGAFRTFYAAATALRAQTDWVQISRNPFLDGTEAASIAIAKAQAASQRAWAQETRQTFINGHEMFGGGYTVANARGLMGDSIHPSTAGATLRNMTMWSKVPLGHWYLGGGGRIGGGTGVIGSTMTSGDVDTQHIEYSQGIGIRSATTGLRLFDQGDLLDNSRVASISCLNRAFVFRMGSGLGLTINLAIDGTAAVTPGFNNMPLGSTSLRWRGLMGGLSTATSTKTGAYTITGDDYTILADATSAGFTVTLPAANTSTGRIFIIKKIDASGNAVTIGGTVDGVSNPTLTSQWQTARVQSNGTAYYNV